MATVKPTLTLTSTDALTDSISLSVTKSLTVGNGNNIYGKIKTTSGYQNIALDTAYGASLVYLKNLSTSTSSRTKSAAVDSVIVATTASGDPQFMELSAGEFALFPWNGSDDIQVKKGVGTAPFLEYAVFEFPAS
jgi:hypothetical protein